MNPLRNVLILLLGILTQSKAYSQSSVYGIVCSSGKKPLPEVHVIVYHGDEKINNTVTSAEGAFNLENPHQENIFIQFSHVGMKTEKIEIGNCLDNEEIDLDTIFLLPANHLDEVTVKSRPMIVRKDKRILFPTTIQKQAATDGLSLLSQLYLPKITIVPGTSNIQYWGNGSVKYYVNDQVVSAEQLRSVVPSSIERVEYISHPDESYQQGENVGCVLKIVTRTPQKGYSGNMIAEKALNRNNGKIGVENRINMRNSELAIRYDGEYTDSKHHFSPDFNHEVYLFEDKSIYKDERDIKSSTREFEHQASMAFFHSSPGKNFLQMNAEYFTDREPNQNKIVSSSYQSDADKYSAIRRENSSYANYQWKAKALYYHLFSPTSLMSAGLNYYHRHTDNQWELQESGGQYEGSIDSHDKGSVWGVHGYALWQKALSSDAKITTTLANNYTDSKVSYFGVNTNQSRTSRNTTSLHTQLYYGKENYSLMLTGKIRHLQVHVEGVKSYSRFEPGIELESDYEFDSRNSLDFSLHYSAVSPSIADISNGTQRIDYLQIRSGNPYFKKAQSIGPDLDINLGIGIFDINAYAYFEHIRHDIQEETFIMENMVKRMANNFNYSNALKTGIELSPELADWLNLTLSLGYNTFWSKSQTGDKWKHRNLWTRVKLNAIWKRWMLSCMLWTHNNDFYGQVLEESGQNLSFTLSRTWLNGKLSTSIMLNNPFSKKFAKQSTKNLSPIAPYTSTTRYDYGTRMLKFTVSYNLTIGKKSSSTEVKAEMETEEGIISHSKKAEIK